MTNKLKYFIGNWKMFGDFSSFKIVSTIAKFCSKTKKTLPKKKIIFCLPNTLIQLFSSKLKNKLIIFGAQNCYYKEKYGPFTGAVSPFMLKKSGAKYVILGHSESRAMGDTNNLIKKKVKSALKQNLNIIFCIGENLSERRKGKTFEILKKQIKDSIEKKFNLKKIFITYEPIWSIGTNKILKSKDLKETFVFIKKFYKRNFKTKFAPITLYGGSVNEINISKFRLINEIDGFLIGGASQSSKKFIDIIKNYYK